MTKDAQPTNNRGAVDAHAHLGGADQSVAEICPITHGDDGIQVSVICQQYVATPMLGYDTGEGIDQYPGVISPEQVAEAVVQGIDAEQFLILPHPDVEQYIQFKTGNYDRWLGGMRKLRRKIIDDIGSTRLEEMHKLV